MLFSVPLVCLCSCFSCQLIFSAHLAHNRSRSRRNRRAVIQILNQTVILRASLDNASATQDLVYGNDSKVAVPKVSSMVLLVIQKELTEND